MAEGVRYIKVAKLDKNGNNQTNILLSLTKLTIPFSSGNVTYDILTRDEHSSYFIYYVENPNLEWADRADINYSFSGSYTGSHNQLIYSPPISSSVDNQGFFLQGGLSNGGLGSNGFPIDSYKIDTYIQKNLHVRVSSSFQFSITDSKSATTSVSASVRIVSSPLSIGTNPFSPTIHAESLITQSLQNVNTSPLYFTGSYDLTAQLNSGSITPGDCVYFEIRASKNGEEYGSGINIQDAVFNNGLFEISSSISSGPTFNTSPEPNFSTNFSKAYDCQPTFNNIITNRRSYQYQDIDYTSGMFIPTNFDLLINDTALKAQVQDSNYTTKRHIRPRYEGSKNTTDDVNSSAITQSTYLQLLHPNDDLGVSTFTLPSIESLDSTMHEFSMGGGTSPEIPGCGAVLVANAYNISGKDSVNIISPLDSSYTELLKSKFPQNSKPYITRYTVPNETIQNNNLSWNDIADAKVIDTYISPPPLSSYMIGSGNSFTGGTPLNNSTLRMSKYSYAPFIDSDGFYSTASSPFITYTSDDTSDNVIKNGLDLGENWYITIFNDLPSPVQGNLDIFNSGSDYSYIGLDNNGNYSDPLANHGVYKITGVETPVYGNVNYSMSISPPLPDTGSGATRWEFGNAGGKGYLIWKAISNPSIVFDNVTLSGVGKGNVITETPTSTVKDNLTYISKKYGENT